MMPGGQECKNSCSHMQHKLVTLCSAAHVPLSADSCTIWDVSSHGAPVSDQWLLLECGCAINHDQLRRKPSPQV